MDAILAAKRHIWRTKAITDEAGDPLALVYGDGVRGDTAALQAALDQCGTINLPPGTFKITRPLAVRPGTHIDGGRHSVLWVDSDDAAPAA